MVWWILGFLALLVFVFVFRVSGKYRRLYGPSHLAECVAALDALKKEALIEDPDSDAPPPHHVTTAGLVILCSAYEDEGGHVWHLSLSYRGGVLAEAGSTRICALLAELLQVEPERLSMWKSESGQVHHLQFMLDQDEHRRVAKTEIPTPGEAELAAMFKRTETPWLQAVRRQLPLPRR